MTRLAVVVLVALALTGCGSDTGSGSTAVELRVFAAASLTEAFTDLGSRFEDEHRGVSVSFNFASSSALARQIEEGAPADVFASADEETMSDVVESGHARRPVTIARNRLALLVRRGNPKRIGGLADLDRDEVEFVLCAPAVPCGRLGAAALDRAGVTAAPASLEENVKAVVSRVVLGEADAGIVYATDVRAAGDTAQGVDLGIPDDPTLEAVYPMAATQRAAQPRVARSWIDYARSPEGQSVLRGFGFRSP